MKTTLLSVVLLLAAGSASAQTVYTSVSVDGHKTFSDRLDETPALETPRAPAGTMANGSRRALAVNASEAGRRLAQAQLKRSQGLAPLAGEQSRDPGAGAGALNHRYWQRQEKLRVAVELSQQRLNAIRAPQLARR